MKTCIKKSFVLAVLVAALGSVLTGQVRAQTLTVLHEFTALDTNNVNSDGVNPSAGLVLTGNTLFGTTYDGGISGGGTVFAMNVDGTGFRTLHNFAGNPDGAGPAASLSLSGNTLFGTTEFGGTSDMGTIFSLKMDGTGYAVLHSFAPLTGSIWGNPINEDGARPQCRLLVSANSIYGVTYSGGKSLGTVFRLNSDGTGFTTLHRFGSASNDGAYPINGVLLSENFLYGATSFGGSKMGGTVFKLQTDGTQFENLHEFEDGVWPRGELILAGDSLFGATYATIFTMQTNGGGFTTLANFGVAENLALSGSTLYTAVPDNASGIVFAIGTDGSAYSEIYRFSAVSNNRPMMGGPHTNFDGAMPQGGVTVRSNILYGTTFAGGYYEGGTVFAVTILPHLSVTNSNDNLILGWPTNYAGIDFRSYAVQATTNLASGVWTANLPAPLIVNGQNTVTNPISRTQQFFRLAQ